MNSITDITVKLTNYFTDLEPYVVFTIDGTTYSVIISIDPKDYTASVVGANYILSCPFEKVDSCTWEPVDDITTFIEDIKEELLSKIPFNNIWKIEPMLNGYGNIDSELLATNKTKTLTSKDTEYITFREIIYLCFKSYDTYDINLNALDEIFKARGE